MQWSRLLLRDVICSKRITMPSVLWRCWFISDIAIFVLKRDVKLQLTNWRCWLGDRKGIRPVKKYEGDGGGEHWLVLMECPAGWSVCLPLLIFPCTIKSRSSLLVPAHPGGPGKRAAKWLRVCVSMGRKFVPGDLDLWPLTLTFKLVQAREKTRLSCEFGTNLFSSSPRYFIHKLEMWANAQHDGHPAEYRWCLLFNAAKFADAHY